MSKTNFWKKQEVILSRIIVNALSVLMTENNLPKMEDEISRRFYYHLLESKRQEGNCLWHFNFQSQNQPVIEDEHLHFHPREHKKPDFTFSINDNLSHLQKNFNLECKRVEEDSKRNFFREYVDDGVLRFKLRDFAYSKSVPLGFMIGYLRKCEYADAVDKINTSLKSQSVPEIQSLPSKQDIKQYTHDVDRPDVLPTPLRLNHLWAKLKEHKTS